MPAKSRRKRGKNLPPSKKTQAKAVTAPETVTESVTEEIEDTAVEAAPAASKKSDQPVAETGTTYPHIKAELRMIGILAVIMLVILIVLGVTL